jgi:C4-dicarboxylate-specific signal transduction histidine kinase
VKEISASVYKEDDSVKVVVQDNGIGISPENYPMFLTDFIVLTIQEHAKQAARGLACQLRMDIEAWRHGRNIKPKDLVQESQ